MGQAERGFPHHVRLGLPSEFARTLQRRAAIRNTRFALHLDMPSTEAESVGPALQWRLGLVVPKRHEASAQRRNVIKRVWREAFRQRRSELQNYVPHHLVIRLAAPIFPKTNRQSSAVLKKLCQQDAEVLLRQMLDKLSAQGLKPATELDNSAGFGPTI